MTASSRSAIQASRARGEKHAIRRIPQSTREDSLCLPFASNLAGIAAVRNQSRRNLCTMAVAADDRLVTLLIGTAALEEFGPGRSERQSAR
jgi:hypothetical protein